MSRLRSAGLIGGFVGIVAAGAAVGLAGERYAVGRARLRPDPTAAEPFFGLPADRTRTVTTGDGVALHVEEVGPADAPLTVVLVHGYTQEMAVWHYQRQALARADGVRTVLYDHRSHGRSGRSAHEASTIDQLGRDLLTVLDEVVPAGPVVLVGHSMGGMTVMALADAHPELFGPRITGVALVSTSTGKLADLTFGLPAAVTPVTRLAVPWLTRGLRTRPHLFERTRRLGTDLAFVLSRRFAFGSTDVGPALVEFVEAMTARTPVDVIGEFYDTFTTHDKLQALDVLRGLPVVIVVGSEDRLTPPEHSRVMADVLPDAELVVVPGCGHMVQLEQPEAVTRQLIGLIDRVRAAEDAPA